MFPVCSAKGISQTELLDNTVCFANAWSHVAAQLHYLATDPKITITSKLWELTFQYYQTYFSDKNVSEQLDIMVTRYIGWGRVCHDCDTVYFMKNYCFALLKMPYMRNPT